MSLDDQQLDELLRDVVVPEDLKARLLEIPDRDAMPAVVSSTSRLPVAIFATLSAIAAMVLVYFCIPPSHVPVANSTIDNENAAALILADMKRNQAAIEEIMETQELGDNFFNSSINTKPIFESDEIVALVLSMASKSSLDQGASFESVRPDLESVVATYPNTRGATQARDLLQIN